MTSINLLKNHNRQHFHSLLNVKTTSKATSSPPLFSRILDLGSILHIFQPKLHRFPDILFPFITCRRFQRSRVPPALLEIQFGISRTITASRERESGQPRQSPLNSPPHRLMNHPLHLQTKTRKKNYPIWIWMSFDSWSTAT